MGTDGVTHQTDYLGECPRKCMEDLDRWADAAYQSPVLIAILSKGLLSFFEKFKDGMRRI